MPRLSLGSALVSRTQQSPGLLLPASTPLRGARSWSSFRASPDSFPKKERHPVGCLSFLERATRKAPKRRLRRMKRGAFEEVSRLSAAVAARQPADTTVSAEAHTKKHHPIGWCFWSGRRGSNSLPRPWQGRALPDELRPQTAPLLRHLGASGRSRTNDTRIFSPLLYQLSYRGIWRPRRGSNPRPPA